MNKSLQLSLMMLLSIFGMVEVTQPARAETVITKQEAVEAAVAVAKCDSTGLFSQPYIEAVKTQVQTGDWVVILLDHKQSELELGAMTMTVIVDRSSGAIISSQTGGGS